MFDLQFLALQSDTTRVATFMLGREQSTRTYPEAGVDEPHHPLSHHGNDPAQIAKMSKVNTYHAALTAKYLERLRATPDQDGSLLDNMTIMYGTCMSNSTRHAGNNVPILVLGGGAGRLKGWTASPVRRGDDARQSPAHPARQVRCPPGPCRRQHRALADRRDRDADGAVEAGCRHA